MYKLFLDDERLPPGNPEEWVVVRSYDQFADVIRSRGIPTFVSFDHDLGEDRTGLDCAKLLVDHIIDEAAAPVAMDFYVHSQNPIGKGNIEGLFRQFLKIWNKADD